MQMQAGKAGSTQSYHHALLLSHFACHLSTGIQTIISASHSEFSADADVSIFIMEAANVRDLDI